MNTKNQQYTLMAVHAHPDDESIGTGGVLSKYSAQGHRVVVVYGTRGEEGDILNPEFTPPAPGMDMGAIRVKELEKALAVLDVEPPRFLGYRDSGMAGTPANHEPNAFGRADLSEATARMVDIIRDIRPHVIVTYNEKGFYGHPDHIMANRVTVAAFHAAGDSDYKGGDSLEPWAPAKLYYTAVPVSRLRRMQEIAIERGEEPRMNPDTLGTPDEAITTRIDVRDYLERKIEALACHQSQYSADNFIRRMPQELREEAFGYEHYMCVEGYRAHEGQETDFFQDLE